MPGSHSVRRPQSYFRTGKLLSSFPRVDQTVLHHKNMEGTLCDSETNQHCFHPHVQSASTFSDTGESMTLSFKRVEGKALRSSGNRASKQLKPLTTYQLSRSLWGL